MRAARRAAFVALHLLACGKGAGYTPGGPVTPISGGTQGPRDSGTADAGPDAGPDAGTGDGGCAGASARPADNYTDYCNGVVNSGRIAAFVDSACSVSLTLSDGVVCTGRMSGVLDAFDGGCQTNRGTLSCASGSLPGTITCDGTGASPCSIVICNGGSCGP